MRVEVEPRSSTVTPGIPTVLTVRVVNTGTVISGHQLRILGVDPLWVRLDQTQLSLFPDSAGVVVLTVTLPPGIPAGVRRIGIEVRELTPPLDRQVIEAELSVPAELGLKVDLDPASTTGGSSTSLGVLIANTGNAEVDIDLSGIDEEGQVRFAFAPPITTLAPGERALATADLRAKRPLLGSPKVRSFKVLVGPAQPPVAAFGTWVQKPRLTRGAIALIGLLTVVSIFALVLTFSLSRVVNKSTGDRDLALQVAQASQAGPATSGSDSIKGTVTLLTSGVGVPGVTVEIFTAADSAQPLASTATADSGAYQFQGLAVGTYKLRFSGAGFTQLWYPTSLTADNATAIALTPGKALTGIDARLGGVPATLSGLVVGADPTGATVSLSLPAPAGAATATPPGAAVSSSTGSAGPAGSANAPAVVTTQILDGSGTFSLAQIPSPSTYQLVVSKLGFATATQQVDLGSGEQRKGIVITLHQGDGSISGQIGSAQGPVGGATVSASDGRTTVSTVSLTQGNVGAFVLNNLPTPDTFTVTVASPGFATQTLTLTLAAAGQLTGVAVTMATGVGSVSGQAKLADGTPAGGVTVTITNGQLSRQTITLSSSTASAGTGAGTFQMSGLPVPSTYTVTFSRADLASQTKAVTLDAIASPSATGVNATMTSATAKLSGTVRENDSGVVPPPCPGTSGQCPIGEITVNLSSGTTSYQLTSASAPAIGVYEFDRVQPGTYTLSFTRPGGIPTSTIITLVAGDQKVYDPLLNRAASISGVVDNRNQNPQIGVEVKLYRADLFPSGQFQVLITDANGRFSFVNLEAPQTYVVQFGYPRGAPGQFTAEVNLALSQQFVFCSAAAVQSTTTVPPGSAPCPLEVTTG